MVISDNNNYTSLKDITEVRITIVMDNYVDILMTDTDIARRYRPAYKLNSECLPVAEHGFSLMVSITDNEIKESFLFDTGLNKNSYAHNLDVLDVEMLNISSIILSHGHFDHVGGLKVIADKLNNRKINLSFHPDALLERKVLLLNKEEIIFPIIDKSLIYSDNFDITTVTEPISIYNGRVLISGEIPRITNFEKGFPIHYSKHGEEWIPDPLIKDDISIILHVAGKGLLIITGCAHSGLINIIRYAVQLTGIRKIYAIIGGFHLSCPTFEKRISETISELKKINPTYIIPCHCTGVTAIHAIAATFPNSFIAPSVGTTFIFG